MSDEDYLRHTGQIRRAPEPNYVFSKTTSQHDGEKAGLRAKIRELEEEIKQLKKRRG